MAYKHRESVCEHCDNVYTKKAAKQRYCSIRCGSLVHSKLRMEAAEYKEYREKNKKQLQGLAIKNRKNPEWSKKIGLSNRRKRSDLPSNIFGCSPRTRIKILKRLKVKCCVCGWNESSCDIHHIDGRKINDPHNHKNLTVVCPNHHRLFHDGKLDIKLIITFAEQYPDWLKHYYH